MPTASNPTTKVTFRFTSGDIDIVELRGKTPDTYRYRLSEDMRQGRLIYYTDRELGRPEEVLINSKHVASATVTPIGDGRMNGEPKELGDDY